jgi:hypothetical protein
MADLDVTFTQLSQLSRAYGAPAVEIAERVLQRSAVGQIGVGAACIAGFAGLGLACGLAARALHEEPFTDNIAVDLGRFFGAIFGGIAAVGCLVFAAISLTDVWAWTALTDPQLALAHRIFGSMGG